VYLIGEGNTMISLQGLPQIVTAIGGLGTAAFGLVDVSKAAWGGVNHIGFGQIQKTVKSLTPGTPNNALSQDKIVATLKANWFNGTALASQKAIAKSLIKLNLSDTNAAALATATGVEPGVLAEVATNIKKGTALSTTQNDVYARFDLIVTALLDQTYLHADNVYRNWTRALAAVVAVVLAVVGGHTLTPPSDTLQSVIVGLLATPLAPIAKDLSTALATAVNTMQLVKK
jgi:hypothetical protein